MRISIRAAIHPKFDVFDTWESAFEQQTVPSLICLSALEHQCILSLIVRISIEQQSILNLMCLTRENQHYAAIHPKFDVFGTWKSALRAQNPFWVWCVWHVTISIRAAIHPKFDVIDTWAAAIHPMLDVLDTRESALERQFILSLMSLTHGNQH